MQFKVKYERLIPVYTSNHYQKHFGSSLHNIILILFSTTFYLYNFVHLEWIVCFVFPICIQRIMIMIIDEVYAKYKGCKELESDKMESMSVCEKWRRIERIVSVLWWRRHKEFYFIVENGLMTHKSEFMTHILSFDRKSRDQYLLLNRNKIINLIQKF